MPGDPIIGFVTRGRGVTIHRSDCANVVNTKETERLIDVSWGGAQEAQRYQVPLEVVSYDREGLIRDITTVIGDERVNISDLRVTTRGDIATIHIVLQIGNNRQLARILAKIEGIGSVVEAYRCNSLPQ
jgi:GTP pyrophosphokinase